MFIILALNGIKTAALILTASKCLELYKYINNIIYNAILCRRYKLLFIFVKKGGRKDK